MKHRWLTMVAVCMVGMRVYAHTNQELFLHGNELYHQGEYVQAREKYDAIGRPGYGVYVHKARTYDAEGDGINALVNVRKAYTQAYGNDARVIAHALACVQQQAGIQDQLSWCEMFYRYSKMYPLLVWQLLLIILSWVLFACYRYCRRSVYALVALIVMLYTAMVACMYHQSTIEHGMIIVPTAIHSGRDERLATTTMLDAGKEVRIHDVHNSWYKISTGNIMGWIRDDACTRV